jgi:hypothetical protein
MLKMSLKALQDLLVGKLTFDRFAADHDMHVRAMRNALAEGRTISRIEVLRCPDDDDDWVLIELAEPDPLRPFASSITD